MSAASKVRRARLGDIVKRLFPKVMQKIFKECVSPRGLQGKYQQKHITIDFTENEISLMEKLPNIDDFTIELCYKILRHENVFREPSCKWGNVPHDSEVEIGDDVQRILNATNDVIIRKSEEISELWYQEFQKRTQEILKRVDKFLGQNTSIQLYQTIQSSNINLTDILQDLALMQQVNVIQAVDIDSEKIERYSRVSRVIIDTFPNILRDIIRSNISANKLYQMCLPHLNSFSIDQKTILNNLQSSHSYDSMDITLIYKLLRQFLLVHPPTKGWGSNPDKVDINLADDVERIRRYRNQLAHRCSIDIDKNEFDDYFNNFCDIGNRMDLNFFHKTNYEQEIKGHKTCSMDMQMQTKYKNALKQLENIKLQFEKKPIKFFWGETFDRSLRNLRSILKEGKSEEGRPKVRLQIIFQSEEEVETTIAILNSLKDEINEDLNGIEFIVATKGSIILHIDILPQLLEADELLQSNLTLLLRKILERITASNTESIDMVVLLVEEFTQWNASKPIEHSVYLNFEIEAELLETDDMIEEQLRKLSYAIFKNPNGSGTNTNTTATLLPIVLENIPNTTAAVIQAQTPVKYNLPVSVNFRQQLNIKRSINENQNISSCIKIGNALVFTDNDNYRLIICNSGETDLHHIPLSYTLRYITKVDSNTIAVSCTYDKIILIINIFTRSVTKKIKTSDYCYGISYNDNNLYVVISGVMIRVIDMTGKVISNIYLPSNHITDITVDRNRLVYKDSTSISCCSLDGKFVWKFKNGKFKDLRRMTTDDDGNVYVTSYNTNIVVVVSDDGKLYRELLNKSDGLNRPCGIYFDKKEMILLVSNFHDGEAILFDVKSKPT
ncbi:unnamed protein product [Mytilus coruscus]|uniref:DZIP3-like HEPN domain-containing protein n=2 Tax=Mytilus coruscus TaxID=42192 RepID=A0A6J8CVU4_MYTCO|nr:unnamed protein product [Mytilus coruscus]